MSKRSKKNNLEALWVKPQTKERFNNHGRKSQTSDELLTQVLDVYESEKGFAGGLDGE